MPISVKNTTGLLAYASALIGNYQTLHVKVNPTTLAEFIDAKGYLKPNAPLALSGAKLTGAAGEVPTLTVEAVKIADSNATAVLAAAPDVFVACAVSGTANRDVIEDTINRDLNVAEAAALNGPNSKIVLSLKGV